jgi:hypothetical protein
MAKTMRKLTKYNEKFAAYRSDYEEIDIERNCESGQIRLIGISEERWRMPEEVISHLEWCIDQIKRLPASA